MQTAQTANPKALIPHKKTRGYRSAHPTVHALSSRFVRHRIGISGFTAPPDAAGQNLSVGIIAGGGFTDGIQTGDLSGQRLLSTSKDYLIGPTLEWNFSQRWSIEADGIFRELHFGRAGIEANGTLNSVSPAPVVTWEFPILAKYRFETGRFHPFLEAGPSFRATGNLNGTNPSHYGVTAGAGVELHVKKLDIAPVLRYTRWAEDSQSTPVYYAKSRPDQLELAVGLATAPEFNAHPLGTRIPVGVLAGVNLTADIHSSGFAFASGTQSFSEITSPKTGVIVGPAVEFSLPDSFFVEADAAYHPLRFTTLSSFNGANPTSYTGSLGNWDLPVLAKRQFRTRFISPFLEAGPAFRVGSGQLSHYGVTAGIGLEAHLRAIRIAPTFRFSHWAAGSPDQSPQSIPNQVEFLTAFYF